MRLIFIISLLLCNVVRAQHVPLISQYMFNDMALNPANTGNQDAFSMFGNFRAQWVGIPGAPLTQTFSVHSPMRSESSALGLQFFADQIGVDKTTGIFANYAYRIHMKEARLSFGLSAGINLVKSNNSQLLVNDAGDDLLADTPLGVMPDFSFGMSYNTKKYFFSFSLPMFLGHKFDGNKIRIDHDFRNYNFMLGAGALLKVSRKVNLKPSFLVKYKIGLRPQADINVMAELHPAIEVGVSYRTEEAIIGLLKFKPTQQLGIMYSFGMPITAINYRQFGSHELGVQFNFKYKTNITNPRYLGW